MKYRILIGVFGFVIGSLFAFVCGRLLTKSENDLPRALAEQPREINLALGKSLLDQIPMLMHTWNLLRSNRVEDARQLVFDQTLWKLENCWAISQEHPGAMENELHPLVQKVFPDLKPNLDMTRYRMYPQSLLRGLTNFITEADQIVQSRPVNTVR